MLKNTVTTLTRLSAACAAVAAISVAQPVFAQTQAPAASPAPAEAAANRSPELSLQATASSEVKQDTVRIALAAEVEGRTSRLRARSSVRCWTTWSSGRATPRASKCARVITTSGPIPAARGKIAGWRGRGEVILESKDFEAAAALASKLSDKTAISSISFSLSRAAREAEERKLLRKRRKPSGPGAGRRQRFWISGYRLSKLELGGSGGPGPMPRMMAMAKDAGGAAYSADVPLESGEVTVSVAVNGTIVLQ